MMRSGEQSIALLRLAIITDDRERDLRVMEYVYTRHRIISQIHVLSSSLRQYLIDWHGRYQKLLRCKDCHRISGSGYCSTSDRKFTYA